MPHVRLSPFHAMLYCHNLHRYTLSSTFIEAPGCYHLFSWVVKAAFLWVWGDSRKAKEGWGGIGWEVGVDSIFWIKENPIASDMHSMYAGEKQSRVGEGIG